MKQQIVLLFILFVALQAPQHTVSAQYTRSLSKDIRTVQTVVNGDPLQPPVARLGSRVEVSFDQLSHAYTRYIYKIEFCNADWTPATEIFESDYLQGFNGRPLEDYETSFNTTVLYTHYRLVLPNEDVRLLLPGNYRVSFYVDEEDNEQPVAEACFSLLSPQMSVGATVTTNTDIDFNQTHQQLSFNVSYGTRRVVDPQRELRTVVMQNRRRDCAVVNLPPNIQKATGVEWNHRRELIFPAGAEFHKFEMLDMHVSGMGIDRMQWFEPFYHATLFAVTPQRNYTYDQDADGAFIVRTMDDEDVDIQADYAYVHFFLQTPRLPGGDVYVCGLWDGGFPDPECRMTYDEQAGTYEAVVPLKQGYYSYQFRQLDSEGVGQTARTEGDFYQTENEYLILVYHRPQGARYDALVGYANIKSDGNH